jgi:DNA-binding transcriptional MerR regulator
VRLTLEHGPARSLVRVEVFSIGQLAEAAGVHVETIRYYERRGLLPAPPRTASGYRQYGADDLWRLAFVRRAKTFGFTLTEVGDLLHDGVRADPASVRVMVQDKLEAIEERQHELAQVRARLERLVDICADPDSEDCTALRVRS